MRAADVLLDDVIETWDGCTYRIITTTPAPSGKVVQMGTVVEPSNDPQLAFGRAMNFGRRADTIVLVHRT